MTWLLTFSLAAVWTVSVRVWAEPVIPCPGNVVGNYYLTDSINRVLYYWCHQGHLMVDGRALRCPAGSRTIPNAHGGSPVCFRPLISTSSTKAPLIQTTPLMTKGMFYVETYRQRHILAGRWHPGITTAYRCVIACYEHPMCYGVDFDNETRTCWLHDKASECNELVSSDCCTHYRLTDMCPTTIAPTMPTTTPLVTTQTTQFPAPQGSFVADDFAAPTVLPSGWQAYPGMQIAGGDVIGDPGMSGDECFELCLSNSTCSSVNFSSSDGTCRSHVAAEKCRLLLSSVFVYHAKKAPTCTIITGTLIRYPAPAATAP